jgi:Na+/H+-dicarboxylate symporter
MSQLKSETLRKFFWKNRLLMFILLAVILGFSAGILANKEIQDSAKPTPKELVMFISFPGEIFLRMLQLLVLPLVVSSVMSSLAILDKESAAKLGARFACYAVATTLLAVIVGIILASLIINPQEKTNEENKKSGIDLNAVHSVLDMIR